MSRTPRVLLVAVALACLAACANDSPTTVPGADLFAAGARSANGTPFVPRANNQLTLAVYGDSPYGTSPTYRTET